MAAVAEETVVPNTQGDTHQEQHLPQVETAHIYFKDLKLLAHDHGEDSEEEHEVDGQPESDGGSSPAASPVGDGSTVRTSRTNYV